MAAPAPVQAQQAAIGELRSRQVGQFRSAGHPKAEGLDLTIGYPRSWQRKEGGRPHVLQNFIASDGSRSNCNILVRPLDNVSPAQAKQILDPSKFRQLVPAAFTYRSGTPITLAGQPGAEVLVERPFEAGGAVGHLRLVIYMTIYRSKLINLTCGVGAPDARQTARLFDAHLPLFSMVKDSLVFRN